MPTLRDGDWIFGSEDATPPAPRRKGDPEVRQDPIKDDSDVLHDAPAQKGKRYASRKMPPALPSVVRKPRDFARLADLLHDEATLELHAAMHGVSGKRMDAAAVPGAGRHGISRALNGCPSNPLYRVVALLLLMKRLDLPRERAQRIVDWFGMEIVCLLWPADEEPDAQATEAALEAMRQHVASAPVVMQALRRMVTESR